MSNEHLEAIRHITATLEKWGENIWMMGEDEPVIARMLPQVNHHAEAMDAELDAEREKTARLQRHIIALEEWAEEDAIDECATYKNVRSGGPGCELQPGDLPGSEGEA